MAELSKDEREADAILDAVTPAASTESSFPEFGEKKAAKESFPKKPIVKKVPPLPAAATAKMAGKIVAESKKPLKARSTSNDIIKKAWARLNLWGLGFGGKVILLLIVIGIFSEILQHF